MLSPLTTILGVAALLIILSQFGGRLAARNALIWWVVVGFFMLSAVAPASLRPIANSLGIEVISNFVLATMIVFILYQLVDQLSATTRQARSLRRLVSRTASREFVAKRGHREPERAGREAPRTLVVVPCYNEIDNLPSIHEQLERLVRTGDSAFDYCIVDDGSVDGSAEWLATHAPGNSTGHMTNIGVSGVLMTGFAIAGQLRHDFVAQCDADGQHPVSSIPEMVDRAHRREVDLMVGSRFAAGGSATDAAGVAATTRARRAGALIIAWTLRLFGLRANATDPTSGFRVYSRRFFEVVKEQMPDEYPEPELLAIAAVLGARIEETPVVMAPRQAGSSSIRGLGKPGFMLKVITALLGLRLRSFSSLNRLDRRRLAGTPADDA